MKTLILTEKELSIVATALTIYANKNREYYLEEKKEPNSTNKAVLLNYFISEYVDTNVIITKINEVRENEN